MRSLKRTFARLLPLLIALEAVLPFVAPLPTHAAIADGMPAIDEVGQYDASRTDKLVPDFTSSGSVTTTNKLGFNDPADMTIDSVGHRLFVTDSENSRVLVFTLNADNTLASKIPAYVLGQSDFATGGFPAASQTDLDGPFALAFDSARHRLFVADNFHNRVVIFDLSNGISNGMSASIVLGQTNFTNTNTDSTASGMNQPQGLAWDSANSRLFVSDTSNNRVLEFDNASITTGGSANMVLGQTAFGNSSSGSGATQMSGPHGLAWDSANSRLFVADTQNSRVLVFNNGSISTNGTADAVLGQPTGFGSGTANNGGRLATTMNKPAAVVYDASGNRLFVADNQNARVLEFNNATISTPVPVTADAVIGQTLFTTATQAVTQAGLSYAHGLAYDATNQRLYVSDGHIEDFVHTPSGRIMTYAVASISNGDPAVDELGEYATASSSTDVLSTSPVYTVGARDNSYGVSAVTLGTSTSPGPAYVTFDTVHHRLFMSDNSNNRILVYNLNSENQLIDHVADFVLGQSSFNGAASAHTVSGLNTPRGLAYDSVNDRLFVADGVNNRVMIFNLSGGITNGMNAAFELGQPAGGTAFTSTSGGTTSSKLLGPKGLSYDSTNQRLFVADGANRRVMVWDFNATPLVANGLNATYVLGQANFTSVDVSTVNASVLGQQVSDVTWDSDHSRLFVADQGHNRVMIWDLSGSISNGMAASRELGQSGFGTSGTATTSTGMNFPDGVTYDANNHRLFVSEEFNHRVLVFTVGTSIASITNGQAAANVIGQANFTSGSSDGGTSTNQAGLASPLGMAYDLNDDRLFVADTGNHRLMIFDVITTTNTNTATLLNTITMSRQKAGTSATVSIGFQLYHNLNTTLSATFTAPFAANGGVVTSDPTSLASSPCLSNFGHNSIAVFATKTNCAGPIVLGGFTVSLPTSPGSYNVTWVNDDPGSGEIIVTSDDQVSITAAVDPSITFNVGSQASATACDGTFSGNGGTVALGTLTTGAVTSSDASSINHICTRVSTNATSGAAVTVKSANASLKSVSVPADSIPSSTATVTAGTEGYGLCAGSAVADSGEDSTSPTSATPAATSPFNGSCTSSAHAVGALTTSAQQVWSISGPSANAFFRLYLKAATAGTTKAHADYTDTLTFVATGTF